MNQSILCRLHRILADTCCRIITHDSWHGVTSSSLAICQALSKTGILVSFYEDDMLPFLLRSLLVSRASYVDTECALETVNNQSSFRRAV
jgi:hypothetical protein